jgi:hypothetical protein
LAGTIAEEGAVGAAIKCHAQIVPILDTPADILEYHNAWRLMEPGPKELLFVFHVLRGDANDKARALGMSRATFYRKVGDAQIKIWSKMIEHESGVSNVRLEAAIAV